MNSRQQVELAFNRAPFHGRYFFIFKKNETLVAIGNTVAPEMFYILVSNREVPVRVIASINVIEGKKYFEYCLLVLIHEVIKWFHWLSLHRMALLFEGCFWWNHLPSPPHPHLAKSQEVLEWMRPCHHHRQLLDLDNYSIEKPLTDRGATAGFHTSRGSALSEYWAHCQWGLARGERVPTLATHRPPKIPPEHRLWLVRISTWLIAWLVIK